MQMPQGRKSIFSILITIFILIVLPIYAGGFLVYFWGISQVQAEIIRSNATQNRYYLDNLDAEIRKIKSQQSALLSDRDIMLLSITAESMSEIDLIFALRSAQDRLRLLLDSSQYIENASLHLPAIGRSVYARGSISEMSHDHYLFLNQQAGPAAGQISMIDNVPVMLMAFPQQYFDQTWISAYILEIQLSQQAINRSLSLMSGGEALVLFNHDGWILASTTEKLDAAVRFHAEFTADYRDYSKSLEFDNETYLAFFNRQAGTGLELVGFTAEDRIYEPLRLYQPLFLIFTGAVIVLIAVFFGIALKLLHRPLRQLMRSFQVLEQGCFEVRLKHDQEDEFGYLYSGFNNMAEKLSNLIEQVYMQKIYTQQAELKQLQSQISPHFLYNSFFVLQNMADSGDTENLSLYTGLMGQYFQYITRNAQEDAFLREETDHARIYATLQARRFRNRISLEFAELPASLHNEPVPRLILQPIIENSFEHGLQGKTGDGRLWVEFIDAVDYFQIIVGDNGEMDPENIRSLEEKLDSPDTELETSGLINVHRRVRLRFGPDSGICLQAAAGGGLVVVLKICRERKGAEDVSPADS